MKAKPLGWLREKLRQWLGIERIANYERSIHARITYMDGRIGEVRREINDLRRAVEAVAASNSGCTRSEFTWLRDRVDGLEQRVVDVTKGKEVGVEDFVPQARRVKTKA